MQGRIFCFYCSVAVALFNSPAFCQEDYSQWSKSQNIVINTTPSDLNISGDVRNFPYLVRLTVKNFNFSEASDNGADIRFAGSDGSHLPYQINNWSKTDQEAAIWVKVPLIKGNDATQYIKMHWGKSDAADQSNGGQVFSSDNGFAAVWHIEEEAAGTGNLGVYKDATGHGNDGTDNIGSTGQTGIIGNGHELKAEQILVDSPSAELKPTDAVSISVWLKCAGNGEVASMGDSYALRINGSMNSPDFFIRNSGGWEGYDEGNTSLTGAWHYVVAQKTTTRFEIYMDGRLLGTQDVTNSIVYDQGTGFSIGTHGKNYADYRFSGFIDELQVGAARSADWISLCFANQCGIEAPPAIKYPTRNISLKINAIIDPITPAIEGFFDSVTITPLPPLYLSVDPQTGVIAGWADQPSDEQTYYVRAYNRKGYSEDTLKIIILPDVGVRAGNRVQTNAPRVRSLDSKQVLLSVPAEGSIRDLHLALYDLTGRRVWSKTLSGTQISRSVLGVDAGNGTRVPAGIYFVEIISVDSENQRTVQRARISCQR
jgi:biopolymer transport protein ExbB